MKKQLFVLVATLGLVLIGCSNEATHPDRVKATFVNYNNSVLYVTSLEYDGTAVYQGATPTRPAISESHHYVFNGWDLPLENIKVDTTFIAQYSEVINTYMVEFKDYDDTLLQSSEVNHGEDVVYSADEPSRENTKQFSYTFNGWDKPLTNITSSQVIHAQYIETVNQYTVTFKDEDGTELGTSTVDYGGTAIYQGEEPTKAATESHHFKFAGWDISLENIQDDCVATAQYTSEINTYTVRFLNYDGTELGVDTVEYDGTATYSGNNPEKPKTQQYSYAFNGWNVSLEHIKADVDATAVFTETVNQYTVIFYNDDGTRLGTSTVDYGGTAVYDGEDPEKTSTAKYSYTFTGWDKPLENITEDCDRHAVFSSSINSYTVTFKNYDGSVLSEETVQYGDDAFYRGETPQRARTQQYTYTFAGWDDSTKNIVCDTTLTAQYDATVNQYTVTFKDYDGTILYTSIVEYGGTATYNLDDPTRARTQQYTYAFTGWDISLENIQDDCVATAQYLATTNQYTVTFKDWNGTILDTVTVDYGTAAIYSKDNPTRPATQQYTYTFAGWDISLTEITDNCVATAQYIVSTKQYIVTFKNYDGTILGTSTVDYGETATYSGEIPTKPENQQYTYTFSGWSISLENITNNCEAVAQFDNVVKQYIVTFKNWDGSVLDTISVDYGSNAVYSKADPTRPATQQYTYTFAGWDISLNNITGNCIATAQYDSTVNQYTVTFKNYDGTILGTKTVDYGTAATYDGATPTKPATAKYSYIFNGWDAQINSITEDCVRIATFIEVTNKYTVTFKNYDGTILGTSTVEYGNAAIYHGATPTKPATQQYTYTFSGWSISLENVTSDRIATAQYDSTVNKYTVTFKNYDGSILGTSTVDYGSNATYIGSTPTKPSTQQYSYSFIGWDKGLNNVTENYVVIAQFSSTVNQYTVTFKNYDGSILGTSTVDYGSDATYTGSTPTRPATQQYTYSFSGWSDTFTNITADKVVTAQYNSTINQYTVTFKNWDGSVLDTCTVEYGSSAFYSGETPTKNKDSQYSYSFNGWDKTFDCVVEDIDVIAQYSSTVNQYTITWKNYDGTILATKTAEYGSYLSYDGPNPAKESKDGICFNHIGWKGDSGYGGIYSENVDIYQMYNIRRASEATFGVFSNITYTAVYEEVYNNLHYYLNGSQYLVIGHDSISGSLTIPNTFDGKRVTDIAYQAFKECTTITGLVLQSNMRRIWKEAFYGCTGLDSIYLNGGLYSIREKAFANCNSYRSIFIPSSVQLIERAAFVALWNPGTAPSFQMKIYCEASGPGPMFEGYNSTSERGYFWDAYYPGTGIKGTCYRLPEGCVVYNSTR